MIDGTNVRAMRYAEFLDKWSDPEFRRRFDPLTRFLERLEKEDPRWTRLVLMKKALNALQSKCEELLGIGKAQK